MDPRTDSHCPPFETVACLPVATNGLFRRYKSDRKTRARQAMISIYSNLLSDHVNASGGMVAEEPAILYAIEVDSPFFQLSRDTVPLAVEPLGNGGGVCGSSGAAVGRGPDTTTRNTTRICSSVGDTAVSDRYKRQNLPKKAELVELMPRNYAGTEPPAETAMSEAGSRSCTPIMLPETNATVLNFYPRAAGSYQCKVLVVRRMNNFVDVRCIDITATVDPPKNATTLIFCAPAGQKITQEVCAQAFNGTSLGGFKGVDVITVRR